MSKRVLVISYYAPPYAGTQSFRLAQFVKHLPRGGWEPTLLAAAERSYEQSWRTHRDPESYSLGGIEMIRVLAPSLESVSLRFWPESAAEDLELGAAGVVPLAIWKRLLARIAAAGRPFAVLLASVISSPDRHIVWAPGAVLRGLRAARSSDLLYASGPPYTNHIVGLTLSKLSRTPLVVMVDDPWLSMDHRVWRSGLQKRIQARQERVILRHAAAILTGTDGFKADLARRNPEVDGKTHVIRWGFDPDDYQSMHLPSAATNGHFELVYTGSLRGQQYDISTLFRVLRAWLDDDPSLVERFRLRIIGAVEPRYERLASELDICGLVSFEGFVPHRELATVSASANALLLIINDTHEIFRSYDSGKIFHYMGLRRPVLALVPPDGGAAALMREKRLGPIAPPNDPVAIRRALENLLAQRHAPEPRFPDCSEYSSPVLVAKVARIFDAAVS